MAIASNVTDLNLAVRDAAIKVQRNFQHLSQSASYHSADQLTAYQNNVNALVTALRAAGATIPAA